MTELRHTVEERLVRLSKLFSKENLQRYGRSSKRQPWTLGHIAYWKLTSRMRNIQISNETSIHSMESVMRKNCMQSWTRGEISESSSSMHGWCKVEGAEFMVLCTLKIIWIRNPTLNTDLSGNKCQMKERYSLWGWSYKEQFGRKLRSNMIIKVSRKYAERTIWKQRWANKFFQPITW